MRSIIKKFRYFAVSTSKLSTFVAGLYLCLVVAMIAGQTFLDAHATELTDSDLFFEIGGSAKSIALGLAAGIAVEDASSLFSNPACLNGIERMSVLCSNRFRHRNSWENSSGNMDASYMSSAFAYRIGHGVGVIAVGVVTMGIDDIPETTFESDLPTGNSFSDKKIGGIVAFSRSIVGDDVWLGLSGRYLQHTLFNNVGSGYGLEFGVRFRLSRNWDSSMVIGRGTEIDWGDHSEESPIYIRVGLGGQVINIANYPISIFFEMSQKHDLPMTLGLGVENKIPFGEGTVFEGVCYFRGGLDNIYIEEREYVISSKNRIGNWATGIGLKMKSLLGNLDFTVDYAYRSKAFWTESFFTISLGI